MDKGNRRNPSKSKRRLLLSKIWRSGILVVLAISISLMLKTFFMDWGLLQVDRYLLYTGCNESIFNVNCEGCACDLGCLYPDSEPSQCAVLSITRSKGSSIKQRSKDINITHRSEEPDKTDNERTSHPKVKTKCGEEQSKLISYIRKPSYPHQHKTQQYAVPNTVHYISLGSWQLSFLSYLSFKSVDLFIKPDYIFIHGEGLPHGEWWDKTVEEVANLYFVRRERPVRIQGVRVQWLEHSTDIMRLRTLYDNGGIYLDTDVIALRSFDPLKNYPVTLGRETHYGLGSGIIVAQPQAPFLCMWLNSFKEYRPFLWNWARYAVWNPNNLAKKYPSLVHVENDTLQRPSWAEADLLFNGHYNWSQNYAVHVWHRYGTVPKTPEEIKHLNSTLGEIMRYIYLS